MEKGALGLDAAYGVRVQPDPIGFAAGDVNLYRYVRNNPINLIDPFGLTAGDKALCEAECWEAKKLCIIGSAKWAAKQLAGQSAFSSIKGKFAGIAIGGLLTLFPNPYVQATGVGIVGASALAGWVDYSSVQNAASAMTAVCEQQYQKCMNKCKCLED